MEKKQVKLLEPIIVGGEELTEITIRRSTVGDEEDAMEMAIRLKRPKNSVTVEVCISASSPDCLTMRSEACMDRTTRRCAKP